MGLNDFLFCKPHEKIRTIPFALLAALDYLLPEDSHPGMMASLIKDFREEWNSYNLVFTYEINNMQPCQIIIQKYLDKITNL